MSMDTADDLEYAENLIGSLAAELRAARERLNDVLPYIIASSTALAVADTYCRPTCRWRDEGKCADSDTCGCLCRHGES